MKTYNEHDIEGILLALKNIMVEKKDELTELDAKVGDGDLGSSMQKGFSHIYEKYKEADFNKADIGMSLFQLGKEFNLVAPSTMGTLVATGLMSMGKYSKGKAEITLSDMTNMLSEAIEGMKKRGKSDVGDKTIIDSLYPAYMTLENYEEDEIKEAFLKALISAKEGAEKTKEMKAKFGRAAYYGDDSIGKIDPGAVAGVYIIEGINNYFNK